MPNIFLIGGPNGAGKTTFAREILTTDLKELRFLNADEIARGLSPFDPDRVARKAGRILLEEIDEAIGNAGDFALESTLSGRAHARILRHAKEADTGSPCISSGFRVRRCHWHESGSG